MLIDTHCHLGDDAFDADRPAVLDRMRSAGVERVLVIESDMARLDATEAWIGTEAGCALATACHPHEASAWGPALHDRLARTWSSPACRAIGEIGLDYHYNHSAPEVQRRVFATQLELAAERNLPVVVHAREADADVAAILGDHPGHPIVLHSFSSGPTLLEAGLAAGWYFSFSGMVTFRSWQLAGAVAQVPGDRLLVETDAPYLAPVPHRGRRNEPAWVAEVAAEVARQRNESVEQVAAVTTRNARQLFWPVGSAPTA